MGNLSIKIYCGNSLDVLKGFESNSIDSIVTDPPYGLSFMGKKWDYDVPSVEIWLECLRVLKPGGHLLAFAGTRTQHRMTVRIEDAGFEIRDMIAWVYGSGFPKSLDVSKAIDREAGAERKVVGVNENSFGRKPGGGISWAAAIESGKKSNHYYNITDPATDEAKKWQGWGTALKPAFEPITMARKPILKSTIAQNVLTWGTGGININSCRVGIKGGSKKTNTNKKLKKVNVFGNGINGGSKEPINAGRFPSNFIHDGIAEFLFGSSSKFFYCAKASYADRNDGCEGLEEKESNLGKTSTFQETKPENQKLKRNNHPTVKPVDLMRYLCRLVTPENGVILDPFMGSGSTGKAAVIEGFDFVGVDLNQDYCTIAEARINDAIKKNIIVGNDINHGDRLFNHNVDPGNGLSIDANRNQQSTESNTSFHIHVSQSDKKLHNKKNFQQLELF